jgi:hypothetical protein
MIPAKLYTTGPKQSLKTPMLNGSPKSHLLHSMLPPIRLTCRRWSIFRLGVGIQTPSYVAVYYVRLPRCMDLSGSNCIIPDMFLFLSVPDLPR